MRSLQVLWRGVFANNPIFRLVLGLCPTLAVTTSLENALGMGMAATGRVGPGKDSDGKQVYSFNAVFAVTLMRGNLLSLQ